MLSKFSKGAVLPPVANGDMLRRIIDAMRVKMAQDPSRGVVRLVAVASVVTGVLVAPSWASAAKPGTTLATFNTPGTYTWTVPHGVKQATFNVFGAEGGFGGGEDFNAVGGLGVSGTMQTGVQSGDGMVVISKT